MKTLFTLMLAIFGCMGRIVCASEVETLVEELKKTAKPDPGISTEGQEIAKKLQAIGAGAIPYLLPLLRDKNEAVRTLTSYVLRDVEGLTEKDLDALIESRRRGDGWIPPAIATIGTPRAVAFLVEELVRERETQTQLTWAIKMLGEKAIPGLVDVFRNEKEWDDKLERTMFFVFQELGDKAVSAIDPLLKIADDGTAPPKRRIRAITAIGSIGLSAQRAVPNLLRWQKSSDAGIRDAATSAILGIGSPEAAPIFVRMLEQAPDAFRRKLLMRDIAELKERGKSAGATVVKYLADEDWDVRVGAARALGYIGYAEAADDLIHLLGRQDDWRLVLSAAESLARLKSERALPALSQVFENHWYPPVREAALTASRAIRDGAPMKPGHSDENFAFEFFAYENAGEEMESLDARDAKSIRFPVAAGQEQEVTMMTKAKDGTVKRERIRGVKVEDGYLAGADRGEWGGEITFIDSKGYAKVIVAANTEAIYKTDRAIFAVTGLAHITMNSGFIFKIAKGAGGEWTATEWRALPGAPRFSRLLQDGSVFVSCYGGIVVVSPDGGMKSLSRGESLKPSTPTH